MSNLFEFSPSFKPYLGSFFIVQMNSAISLSGRRDLGEISARRGAL